MCDCEHIEPVLWHLKRTVPFTPYITSAERRYLSAWLGCGCRPTRLTDIAERYGVSKQCISQLCALGLKKLFVPASVIKKIKRYVRLANGSRRKRCYICRIRTKLYGQISIDPMSGCWNFGKYPYPATPHWKEAIKAGFSKYAHRTSWMLSKKILLKSNRMWVLHHCDNPLCINPKHLYLGTPKDNAEDRDHHKHLSVQERRGLRAA